MSAASGLALGLVAGCEIGRWLLNPVEDHAVLHFAVLALEGGAVILLVRRLNQTRDNAERTLAAAEVARAAAENSDRAKQEFLARVTHEWRGPLNTMSSWVWQLERRAVDRHFIETATAGLGRAVDAQRRFVSDLLDFSRGSAGKLSIEFDRVVIRDVVARAIESVSSDANEKGLAIGLSADHNDDLVSGDAIRLEQVFTNILDNATKFTPRGGTISIALTRTADEIEVRVADTGVGIAPADLPEIFNLFGQTNRRRDAGCGGLGLGLSIARDIVELHGGSLMASSAGPGTGSVFTVLLPAASVRDRIAAAPGLSATDSRTHIR